MTNNKFFFCIAVINLISALVMIVSAFYGTYVYSIGSGYSLMLILVGLLNLIVCDSIIVVWLLDKDENSFEEHENDDE